MELHQLVKVNEITCECIACVIFCSKLVQKSYALLSLLLPMEPSFFPLLHLSLGPRLGMYVILDMDWMEKIW